MTHAPKSIDEILTQAVWLEFRDGAKAAEGYLMGFLGVCDAPELREAVEQAILKSKTRTLNPEA